MKMVSRSKKKSLKPTNYRKKILDAALKVFVKKGYQITTMIDVAKAAKVGIGTLYNYFKNKDELFVNCADMTIRTELENVRKLSEKHSDPMDKLEAYFLHHDMLLKEKPYIARFLVAELRQSETFFEINPTFNPLRYYTNFVREMVEKAKQTGRIKQNADADAMAIMLIGAMDMLICQSLIDPEAVDTQEIIRSMRSIVAHGIRPPGFSGN